MSCLHGFVRFWKDDRKIHQSLTNTKWTRLKFKFPRGRSYYVGLKEKYKKDYFELDVSASLSHNICPHIFKLQQNVGWRGFSMKELTSRIDTKVVHENTALFHSVFFFQMIIFVSATYACNIKFWQRVVRLSKASYFRGGASAMSNCVALEEPLEKYFLICCQHRFLISFI